MIKTILNQTTTSELLNSTQLSRSIGEIAENINEASPSEDWDALATLSKADLDSYALENYGIELNQSNTKSNMLLDFQAQLAEL